MKLSQNIENYSDKENIKNYRRSLFEKLLVGSGILLLIGIIAFLILFVSIWLFTIIV